MEKMLWINVLLLVSGLADIFLGSFISIKKHHKESARAFSFFCWWIGLWTLGILAFRLTDNMTLAYFFNQEFIFTAGLIPLALVHFACAFVKKPLTKKGKILGLS